MTKLKNQWAIMNQALPLVHQHKKLLWLPLCNLLGILVVLVVFALPLLLPLNAWDHASVRAALESWGDDGYRTVHLLTLYIAIIVVLTVINTTFYHAIIQAYNGNTVSISRGLTLTISKLPTVLQWSLVAGVVGALIRVLEDTVGTFARWILALVGISWSVASIFALPVLLRESASKSPAGLLRDSARLIRQRWGEGFGGIISFRLMAAMVLVGGTLSGVFLLFAAGNLLFPAGSSALAIWRGLSVVGTATLAFLAAQFILLLQHIYICGLYIFACEGVIPENFDENTFDTGWVVK